MWKRHLLFVVLAGSVLTVTNVASSGTASASPPSQSFFSPVSTFGSSGSGAGQMVSPQGVAVRPASGNVYVADTGNDRIDVFGPTGSFIEAFGWGVADGAPRAEVCTTSCQAGIAGSGPGQFSTPTTLRSVPRRDLRRTRCSSGTRGTTRSRRSMPTAISSRRSTGHRRLRGISRTWSGWPGQERQPLDGRRFHEQRRRVRRGRRFREPVDRLPRFAQRSRRRLRTRIRPPDDPIPIRLLFRPLRRRHRAVDLDRYLRRGDRPAARLWVRGVRRAIGVRPRGLIPYPGSLRRSQFRPHERRSRLRPHRH